MEADVWQRRFMLPTSHFKYSLPGSESDAKADKNCTTNTTSKILGAFEICRSISETTFQSDDKTYAVQKQVLMDIDDAWKRRLTVQLVYLSAALSKKSREHSWYRIGTARCCTTPVLETYPPCTDPGLVLTPSLPCTGHLLRVVGTRSRTASVPKLYLNQSCTVFVQSMYCFAYCPCTGPVLVFVFVIAYS